MIFSRAGNAKKKGRPSHLPGNLNGIVIMRLRLDRDGCLGTRLVAARPSRRRNDALRELIRLAEQAQEAGRLDVAASLISRAYLLLDGRLGRATH